MTDRRSADAPDATDAPALVGAGWGWIMAYGVVSLAIGIAAVVWPFAATYAATLVVGAFLIAAGAMSIGAGAFGRGHEGRGYAIGMGVVSLAIGIVLAFEPYTGALSLTLLVSAWLLLRGVMEIVLGTRFRRGRGLMIALGVVNVLLALVIIGTIGVSAMVLPGYILAISFLFGGVTAIVSAGHHRRGAAPFALPA